MNLSIHIGPPLLLLGALAVGNASCSRTNGGGGGGGGGSSCIAPSHLQGEWEFRYGEVALDVSIAEDGSSWTDNLTDGSPDVVTGVPIGDDICDVSFDFSYDYGDGDTEDYRYFLTKTNGSGLNIAIPDNFDICDAPESALNGSWELRVDPIDDDNLDDVFIQITIADGSAELTVSSEGDPPEEWTHCVVGGGICDLTLACDDVPTMTLQRL